mmetsp:Transcript_9973/g.21303  ORF Transcript_9973/g.21303 Transcript_9973/m.21303 type:complete len:89 (+) Transcript_9973:959-1225(+)
MPCPPRLLLPTAGRAAGSREAEGQVLVLEVDVDVDVGAPPLPHHVAWLPSVLQDGEVNARQQQQLWGLQRLAFKFSCWHEHSPEGFAP